MIRLGLAGVGIHGGRYARHLLAGDVPGAALGAISRSNAREGSLFALQNNLTYAADPAELAILPGIDAVIACLPPDLHARVAIACLEAGRPVLVEKPLAATVEDAERVLAAASRTRTPIMVAHTLRFDPLVVAIKREAASLGSIRMVSISQRFEPTTRGWIDTPGRGGAVLNTGVHAFDLLRFLTGASIDSMHALGGSAVTRRTEDQFVAAMRLMPGDILATVDNARTTQGRTGRIEIACERGQVHGDHVHRELVRIEGRERISLGPVPSVPTVPAAMRAFVACLSSGAAPPVTAEDGAAAVRACARALAMILRR
ncbi:MAG TPA: Gfo/Idh/MocA family oxidoreductase [Candidatus Polarisedimenticolaceae bacterium]|nr:Gfo/Idh/MocA family oxidoreductase [Candidatus Polarisedimenticolaceae bacterium]